MFLQPFLWNCQHPFRECCFRNSWEPSSRSSHQRCSMKKGFPEISQNSKENTCASLFFNKVAGLRPSTLLKKRPWHRCFPVNFVKFLRTPFLQTILDACFCSSLNFQSTRSEIICRIGVLKNFAIFTGKHLC